MRDPRAGSWSSDRPFEPLAFRLRLGRARAVVNTYRIHETGRHPWRRIFAVAGVGGHGPYKVTLDLSGAAAHRCSCPDGQVKVTAFADGGSLCKHVMACALRHGCEHLLAPFLCLSRIARSTCAAKP